MKKMNFERSHPLLPHGVEVGGWLVVVALVGYWGVQLARPLPHLAPRSGSLPPETGERRWETVFSAPVVNLPIHVWGIITSTSGGVALLAPQGEPVRAWQAGQEVLPGVYLVRVDKRSVTLARGGQEETLTLTVPSLPKGTVFAPPRLH
ncbi:MAG: hypothetical protein GJU73_02060 [Ferrovum sp.]|jgi:hypothetical protein|uniref:hypothetical protein n=1 Tax=Ferrovum sp. TaxID=2609467 RepID=UPI00262961A0|nr:hypothetical protein [Ferrovum sp.]MBW8066204.1 hypothetical protein [Ferrovum sp.]